MDRVSTQNIEVREPEDNETKFKRTLRNIITLAPKIQSPHEQLLMHEWVERLLKPPCSDLDVQRRLEYSRYLMFQLARGKLQMPFLQSPGQGTLKSMEDILTDSQRKKQTN